MKPRQPIEIHIDELLLPSRPHGGEGRLRAAIEAELQRQLALRGMGKTRNRHIGVESLAVDNFDPRHGKHAEAAGQQIASKISQKVNPE